MTELSLTTTYLLRFDLVFSELDFCLNLDVEAVACANLDGERLCAE